MIMEFSKMKLTFIFRSRLLRSADRHAHLRPDPCRYWIHRNLDFWWRVDPCGLSCHRGIESCEEWLEFDGQGVNDVL